LFYSVRLFSMTISKFFCAIGLLRSTSTAMVALMSLQLVTLRAQNNMQTQPPVPTETRSIATPTNIPYVTGGGPLQQLDLYYPTDRKGEPLIVVIHGGGWVTGDKAGGGFSPLPLDLLFDGYAIASINYRLAPGAIWPAQIQDCKAAIRWLRAHANNYGYDPNRIGVYGESAGAHLAVLLAITGATDLFDSGENLGYSSAVSCVVDMFGPTDLVALAQTAVGQSILPGLFGGPIGDHLDLARSASPINYVNRSEPPMLVVHGTRDAFVPYAESVLFTEAMTRANARYDFHTVTGGGHGTYCGFGSQGIGALEDRAVRPMIHAFFARYLEIW
jgi:acetyl esterase/lipase